MVKIYNVSQRELVESLALELRKEETIVAPEWASFVKTGTHKQRPPQREDWWYVRAAAILRSVALLGPVGVCKLRTKYGGKKRRGHKPAQFRKGSGSIIRKVLQQLEKAGHLKKEEKELRRGRLITPKAQKLLDQCARSLIKIKAPAKKVEVKEEVKVEKKAEVKQEKVEAKPEVKETPKVEEQPKAEIKKETPQKEDKKE